MLQRKQGDRAGRFKVRVWSTSGETTEKAHPSSGAQSPNLTLLQHKGETKGHYSPTLELSKAHDTAQRFFTSPWDQ